MTGATPAGGITFLAASSILKCVGGISGSGTCLTVTTMSNLFSFVYCLGNDLGHIANGETLFDVHGPDAIFEHGDAERAADGDTARVGGDGLLESVVADTGAAVLLHEGACAVGAT